MLLCIVSMCDALSMLSVFAQHYFYGRPNVRFHLLCVSETLIKPERKVITI